MRITKETLGALKTDDPRGRRFYDSIITGFAVRVLPNGKKTFEIRYGDRKHRRRVTLGKLGELTLDQARELAKDVLARARRAALGEGPDPAEAQRRRRTMPTVGAWTVEYMSRIRGRLKSSKSIGWNLDRTVAAWSARALDGVTRADVEVLFQKIGKTGPTGANRWLAYTRSLFAEAVREGLLTVNPCSGITKMIEKPPRDRVLSDDEMARLIRAVDELEDVHAKAAFYVLIETGARLSEVLRAKWTDIDTDSATWRLPSPKSGRVEVVPLSRAIVAKLRRLPRLGEYVVAGRRRAHPATAGKVGEDLPRFDLKGPWETVKMKAGLSGVTIHDIRRSFGLAVARSAGLHVASRLLRHSDPRITERVYAPLGIEDLRAAVEKRSEVLPFAGRRKGGRS